MLKRILVLIICIGLMIPLCGCEEGGQALLEFEKAIAGLTKAFNANEKIYEYDQCRLVITDGANVMTDEEEENLAKALEYYCKMVDVDVLICTTNTASMSASKYGSAYISRFFPNDSENSISFVLDLNHNEWLISWDGYLTDSLSDSYADGAFNIGAQYLKDEQYANGFQEMAKHMLQAIAKIKH